MNEIIERKVCLKFCDENEISCTDSLKMLEKACGESVLSKTRAYEWYKAFKEGQEIVEDMPFVLDDLPSLPMKTSKK